MPLNIFVHCVEKLHFYLVTNMYTTTDSFSRYIDLYRKHAGCRPMVDAHCNSECHVRDPDEAVPLQFGFSFL